ncbi:class I SAM-dependent methyltransferase [Chengkuizengella axinellae]|uniref:Class I SAM-dependent methyltransferase n=1 Tax=Chengkuizengella axinellae TaxID=3064388 RepID=A0ABT9IZN5_9BACL|nr:class I SAM-dependent methyltransferase [Chengkuizengella sp. 2205SS18-9]MDP5274839.1 class I SAM-dependent methyltransferase [Chengkuizengella sp. 2205SS18-9]
MLYNKDTYKTTLKNAFLKHYEEGSDEWSHDESLSLTIQRSIRIFNKLYSNICIDVLDIGCGNGCRIHQIDNLQSYIGIDLIKNKEWVKYLENKCITFVEGDVFEWSQGSNQKFHLIIDNGCFHHQHPNLHDKYFELVLNKLKVDSLFSLVVWGEAFIEGNIDGYGRIHSYFSVDNMVKRLEEKGFDVIDVYEFLSSTKRKQIQFICRACLKLS